MIRQRISGLFCAVSIASLIARYMSCVIAFFFSGRRSVITRVACSSVTIKCSVMRHVPKRPAATVPRASLSGSILHEVGQGPSPRPPYSSGAGPKNPTILTSKPSSSTSPKSIEISPAVPSARTSRHRNRTTL